MIPDGPRSFRDPAEVAREIAAVTEIDVDVPDGDAFAPTLDDSWTVTHGEWQTSKTGLRYRFCTYRR